MKRRSSNQIKNMIIVLVILIVLVLIASIIFLFNVKINSNSENENVVNEESESKNITHSYYKLNINNMNTNLENINVTYNLIKSDKDGMFKFTLEKNKIYFQINDKTKFESKYENTKLDTTKKTEVVLNDYKIVDFVVGNIKDDLYLVVVTDSGNISYMNIDEAINKNVFRIKNELKTFESSVMQIQNAIKVTENNETETVVVITADNKNYDLESFVE